MRLYFLLLLAVLLHACSSQQREEVKPEKRSIDFGILGAMPEEVALFKQKVNTLDSTQVNGYTFYTGTLNSKNIVFAIAGIGKVNAAMSSTLMIATFHPKAMIMTGIAGALNEAYKPGDLLIASAVSQHDFGKKGESFEHWATINPSSQADNPMWFESDAILNKKATTIATQLTLPLIKTDGYTHTPSLFSGKITTGDVFVADHALKIHLTQWGADAVEMEGGAVAQVCYQMNIPLLLLRAISDSANEEALISYDDLKPHVANLSAFVTSEIIAKY